jgi:hypothetical protein
MQQCSEKMFLSVNLSTCGSLYLYLINHAHPVHGLPAAAELCLPQQRLSFSYLTMLETSAAKAAAVMSTVLLYFKNYFCLRARALY